MAYKFQDGAAALSGNLTINGPFDLLFGTDSESYIGVDGGNRPAGVFADLIDAPTIGVAGETTLYGDGSNLTGITSDNVDVTGSSFAQAMGMVLAGGLGDDTGLAVGTSDGANTLSTAVLTFNPSTVAMQLEGDQSSIAFGADSEVVLKHIPDNGLMIETVGDGGADAFPQLVLRNKSADADDNDELGVVVFRGFDSGDNNTDYFKIFGKIKDETDTTEDGALVFESLIAGSAVEVLDFSSGNEGAWSTSRTFHFSNANAIKIGDGSNIGTDSDPNALSISAAGVVTLSSATAATSKSTGALVISGGGLGVAGSIYYDASSNLSGGHGYFAGEVWAGAGGIKLDTDGIEILDGLLLEVGDDIDVAISNTGSNYAAGTLLQVSGNIGIADDADLIFGNQADASIQWVSADSELVFAGNSNFSNDLEVGGSVTLCDAVTDSVTIAGVTTVTNGLTASMGMLVKDDHKLYFGNGQDASFEYDEDSTDRLLYDGAGLRFTDDTTLEFGTGGEATIEYDEDGTDELRFGGSVAVTFEQAVSFDSHVVLGDDADVDIVSVSGSLQMDSGLRYTSTYVAVESTCALALTSSYIIGKADGAQAVRLPRLPEHGDWYAIKRHPRAGGDITISGSAVGGDADYHIDDATEVVLETAGAAVTLVYEATTKNWNIF
tara:strand:+ start:1668 stop:3659 length:1992 start_codon:yes stop_codon:yes gene_type:complete